MVSISYNKVLFHKKYTYAFRFKPNRLKRISNKYNLEFG